MSIFILQLHAFNRIAKQCNKKGKSVNNISQYISSNAQVTIPMSLCAATGRQV